MNISERPAFDKEEKGIRTLFLPLLILLVAGASFGVGRLTATGEREAIKIDYDPSLSAFRGEPSSQTANVLKALPEAPQGGEVVGSKNGTKYHYAHCPGAKQIKEENRVIFSSPSQAEASGYTLASNCKGR